MTRWFGIAAPGLTRETTALDQITAAVGQAPTIANWYESWSWRRAFPVAEADRLRLWGATPQITWEPWNPDVLPGNTQPAYSLANITKGDFDAYVRSWATGIKSWGKPLRIRFAHEMNGNWYPWSEGVNGNQSGSYVKAWWHVRGIFDSLEVTNVEWVWCPQTPYPGTVPMEGLYPGHWGVDEVSLDGYNWCMKPGDLWNSFDGVFKRGIAELATFSKRPVTIGETGCPEVGGDKALWIKNMWATLATWPWVRGVLWFNWNKEADWRIDSSAKTLEAFRAGLPAFLNGAEAAA